MKTRLIVAIITTLLDDVIILALLIWGLPRLGIKLPIPVFVVIGIILIILSILIYISGSKALRKKVPKGMTDMTGLTGTVISNLDPEGMIRIKGERWKAKTYGETIYCGEEVIVTGQSGLTLFVHKEKAER